MQDLHRQFLAYLLTYPQGFAQLLSEKGACVTVMPSCCLIHAMYYVELATNVATPIRLRRTPPQRGNDSLHFARRYRSFKMCSLCIHGKASHVIFGSLSLPYKSRSLATLFRGENITSLCYRRAKSHMAEHP